MTMFIQQLIAMPFLVVVVVICILPQLSVASPGLRRLRNNAVRVPDLNNNNNNNKVTGKQYNSRRKADEAGFEEIEDKLEELFFNEVFRLDASMSFSYVDDSHATGGGDGSSGGGGMDDGTPTFEKCGVSEQTRSHDLLDILSTVSDRSMLEDQASSRYKARNWVDKEDAALICAGNQDRVIQRYRAALIYFQFNGDGWDNCRANGGSCFQEDSTSVPAIPFLDSSNECLWFGLSCPDVPREALPDQRTLVSADQYIPITSVDISDNGLSGDLFVELFGMVELQELTLDGNKGISGFIPEEIGQLRNLIAVDIDDNALVGPLPDSLFTLPDLEAIDLNSNSLTGTISNKIGDLKKLVVVQLDNNEFTGPMPTDGLFQLEALGKYLFVQAQVFLVLSFLDSWKFLHIFFDFDSSNLDYYDDPQLSGQSLITS